MSSSPNLIFQRDISQQYQSQRALVALNPTLDSSQRESEARIDSIATFLPSYQRPSAITDASTFYIRRFLKDPNAQPHIKNDFRGTVIHNRFTSMNQTDVKCAEFVPSEWTIWVANKDGSISIFDINTYEEIHRTPQRNIFCNCMKFVYDNVWGGFSDGFIRILDPKDRSVKLNLCRHKSTVTAIVHQDGGKYVFSASSDFSILQWDANTFANTAKYLHGSCGVRTLSINFDILFSGGDDGVVRVWDIFSHECQEWNLLNETLGIKSPVTALLFAEQQLWIGQENGTLQVLDGLIGKPLEILLNANKKPILMLQHVGSTIWSSCLDTVSIWDGFTRQLLKQLTKHNSYVVGATLSHKSLLCRVWTMSTDGDIIAWDTESELKGDETRSIEEVKRKSDEIIFIKEALEDMQKKALELQNKCNQRVLNLESQLDKVKAEKEELSIENDSLRSKLNSTENELPIGRCAHINQESSGINDARFTALLNSSNIYTKELEARIEELSAKNVKVNTESDILRGEVSRLKSTLIESKEKNLAMHSLLNNLKASQRLNEEEKKLLSNIDKYQAMTLPQDGTTETKSSHHIPNPYESLVLPSMPLVDKILNFVRLTLSNSNSVSDLPENMRYALRFEFARIKDKQLNDIPQNKTKIIVDSIINESDFNQIPRLKLLKKDPDNLNSQEQFALILSTFSKYNNEFYKLSRNQQQKWLEENGIFPSMFKLIQDAETQLSAKTTLSNKRRELFEKVIKRCDYIKENASNQVIEFLPENQITEAADKLPESVICRGQKILNLGWKRMPHAYQRAIISELVAPMFNDWRNFNLMKQQELIKNNIEHPLIQEALEANIMRYQSRDLCETTVALLRGLAMVNVSNHDGIKSMTMQKLIKVGRTKCPKDIEDKVYSQLSNADPKALQPDQKVLLAIDYIMQYSDKFDHLTINDIQAYYNAETKAMEKEKILPNEIISLGDGNLIKSKTFDEFEERKRAVLRFINQRLGLAKWSNLDRKDRLEWLKNNYKFPPLLLLMQNIENEWSSKKLEYANYIIHYNDNLSETDYSNFFSDMTADSIIKELEKGFDNQSEFTKQLLLLCTFFSYVPNANDLLPTIKSKSEWMKNVASFPSFDDILSAGVFDKYYSKGYKILPRCLKPYLLASYLKLQLPNSVDQAFGMTDSTPMENRMNFLLGNFEDQYCERLESLLEIGFSGLNLVQQKLAYHGILSMYVYRWHSMTLLEQRLFILQRGLLKNKEIPSSNVNSIVNSNDKPQPNENGYKKANKSKNSKELISKTDTGKIINRSRSSFSDDLITHFGEDKNIVRESSNLESSLIGENEQRVVSVPDGDGKKTCLMLLAKRMDTLESISSAIDNISSPRTLNRLNPDILVKGGDVLIGESVLLFDPNLPQNETNIPFQTGVRVIIPGRQDLETVAKSFNISTETIISSNPELQNFEEIPAGTAIILPFNAKNSTGVLQNDSESIIHKCKSDETVHSVAHRYGFQPETLVKSIPETQDMFKSFSPGQSIIVPSTLAIYDYLTHWLDVNENEEDVARYYNIPSSIIDIQISSDGRKRFVNIPVVPSPDYKKNLFQLKLRGTIHVTDGKDTSESVSFKYGVPIDRLSKINQVFQSPSSVLTPGKRIVVTSRDVDYNQLPTELKVMISSDDTVSSIANRYGVSVDVIYAHNTFLKVDQDVPKNTVIKIVSSGGRGGTKFLVHELDIIEALPKDSLSRIAYRYGVTIDQLRYVNPNISENMILNEGTRVIITSPHVLLDTGRAKLCLTDHDTLKLIAERYDTSENALQRCNPKSNFFAGDLITIPCSRHNLKFKVLTVDPDDTVSMILKKNPQVKLSDLLFLNPELCTQGPVSVKEIMINDPVYQLRKITFGLNHDFLNYYISGDEDLSLDGIALKFNCSPEDLQKLNPQINRNEPILKGTRITLPKELLFKSFPKDKIKQVLDRMDNVYEVYRYKPSKKESVKGICDYFGLQEELFRNINKKIIKESTYVPSNKEVYIPVTRNNMIFEKYCTTNASQGDFERGTNSDESRLFDYHNDSAYTKFAGHPDIISYLRFRDNKYHSIIKALRELQNNYDKLLNQKNNMEQMMKTTTFLLSTRARLIGVLFDLYKISKQIAIKIERLGVRIQAAPQTKAALLDGLYQIEELAQGILQGHRSIIVNFMSDAEVFHLGVSPNLVLDELQTPHASKLLSIKPQSNYSRLNTTNPIISDLKQSNNLLLNRK